MLYQSGEVAIELDKQGELSRRKVSYPMLVGTYHRLTLPGFVLFYDQNGDIKYIRGRGRDWPHPSEWLKRTRGNTWVYYFSGRYTEDLFDWLGEYYLPCFQYASNSLWRVDPFAEEAVQKALAVWKEAPFLAEGQLEPGAPSRITRFLHRLRERGEAAQEETTRELWRVLGDRIRVLPPDTRHVDYEVLPLIIADGCLYNCSFCRVKSGRSFHSRTRAEVREQLRGVLGLLDQDLVNHNAAFLGLDDALNAGEESLIDAATMCLHALRDSPLRERYLFLFGSVHSLLGAPEGLWRSLARLPCRTYVNIGLESADQATLDQLGKPVRAGEVGEAFRRMLDINERYDRVEVSANFVVDPDLPRAHWRELEGLLGDGPGRTRSKGTVYLSPLHGGRKREHIHLLHSLKMRSRLPLYLYLIQQL
ncbi:MAG: hypothetical protein K9J48_04965 [Desulfohalobiaceae bacterium]|nr:hypothetical protein [Desulfohalobiaceae bacterium]